MRFRVQDDEIRPDALRPPVPVRREQLPDAGHTGHGANRRQHDRPIAGDPLSPQRLLSELDGGSFAGRSAKRFVRIDERARQLLIEREVGRLDVEVAHLHFGLGPREARGALGSGDVAIAIGDVQRGFARGRHGRGESDGRRTARLDAKTNAQSDDRIEHRADSYRTVRRRRPARAARERFGRGRGSARDPSRTSRRRFVPRPPDATTCTHHGHVSPAARGRRLARSAADGTHSVSTNSF